MMAFTARLVQLILGCLVLISVSGVIGQPTPTHLNDGAVVTTSSPNSSLNFYRIDLHSWFAANKLGHLSAIESEEEFVKLNVTVPPLQFFFTNLSVAVGDKPTSFPDIYVSWENDTPNATDYNYHSTSGIVIIPGTDLVGQYAVNIGIDLSSVSPSAYTLGATIFNPVVLSSCPSSRPQTGAVEAGGVTYFWINVATRGDVQFMTQLMGEGANSNNVNLYVSTRPYPTAQSFIWSSDNTKLSISGSDPSYPPNGIFYIAVASTSSDEEDVTPFVMVVSSACQQGVEATAVIETMPQPIVDTSSHPRSVEPKPKIILDEF